MHERDDARTCNKLRLNPSKETITASQLLVCIDVMTHNLCLAPTTIRLREIFTDVGNNTEISNRAQKCVFSSLINLEYYKMPILTAQSLVTQM